LRAEKGESLPAEWHRYSDPLTELDVLRLTSPEHTCVLPASYNRTVSRQSSFLLYSSDCDGTMQAYRMDLKTGERQQLTTAAQLDPASLTLTADSRNAVYFDGRKLMVLPLANLRERAVYTVPEGWERSAGFSVTGDGAAALFGESKGEGSRLRTVPLQRGAAGTIVEQPFAIEHPVARPVRAQILYRQGAEALWLVNSDGAQNRKLKVAEGVLGPANWAPEGKTVLYLRFPGDRRMLNEIREHTPDANADALVAKTSQFAHFGFNRDSSVFVGASRNAASPAVLLLLRVTRREFTLCEHKASAAGMVAPIFSPDAQRIFFASDRDGKPAIYCMHVDKLVEKIETES
jgi:oligogalacturonide lyase